MTPARAGTSASQRPSSSRSIFNSAASTRRAFVDGQLFPPHVQSPRLADFVFAFHDDDEIGPKMLSRIAKRTGLTPEDP